MKKRDRCALAVFIIAAVVLAGSALAAQQPPGPKSYTLKPTPKTIAWGYYDASTPPALRVQSGDTVEIHTLPAGAIPSQLEAAGVPPEQIEQSLRDIVNEVTDKGPGGHILTGPIYVEGAQPGNVLEIRILSIRLAIPYAYNRFRPGFGFLPDDFPYTRTKIISLDEKRGVAHFGAGIEIPLGPFFGSIGVAPPGVTGRISSAPPWIHGGNLTIRNWWLVRRCFSRCMPLGRCCLWATAMPVKATGRSTSPRWKPL
jgi:acetamidase/formamidase